MLSFSTCWNSSRHESGREVAREILDLGFQRIELSHGLRAPMVSELLAAKDELGFEVSSLHCFCPLPPEVLADNPDCYEFTSDKPESRRRALKMAMQTIDMAERFGAPCVVVHAGRIRSLSATRHLRELAAQGGLLEKEYAREKLEAVRRREAAGPTYLRRSWEALQKLAAHAADRGVRLGIENRDDYEAVPSEREVDELLRKLNCSPCWLLARLWARSYQAQPWPARPPAVDERNGRPGDRLPHPRCAMAVQRPPSPIHRRGALH